MTTTLKKVEKLKFLSGKDRTPSEAALLWTLAYDAVSTSIPGIRNLKQAQMNCIVGDRAPLAAALAKKAEGLYRKNFGLPIKPVVSDRDVPAVFISGARVKAEKKGAVGKARRKKGTGSQARQGARRKPVKRKGRR